MKVFHVRNVCEALPTGIDYILTHGVREESRAGPVLVAPEPVTTVYSRPQERVLFSPARDANAIFHCMESLWMLAGRQDAKWLDQFVHDFSSRFAEDDGIQHGAYGFRWRKAFGFDQLNAVIEILKKDPHSRQCVISMWDASVPGTREKLLLKEASGTEHIEIEDTGYDDLRGVYRDRPCNTHCYLRIREDLGWQERADKYSHVLDLTVCCRSNDIWWGAYGANAVHFSILLEYLAARIGAGIGTYTQISNNYHLYENMIDKAKAVLLEAPCEYPTDTTPIVTHPNDFDRDLKRFFASDGATKGYINPFFSQIAVPMYWANRNWKAKNHKVAFDFLGQMPGTSDWFQAALEYHLRRMAKLNKE